MAWTKDQEKAIYKSGQNIIVSAGAGSGKTAVLSERILEKVKSGVSVDSLLVLTFTEAAAFEMKERIKKKVKDNPSTTHLASDVDSAYITTFDSYALSIVKKYHYLLGIDKNINVIDNSIIELFKINTLNSIFESLYEEKDALFLEFINKYCLKNDNQLKKEILNIDKKLDLKLNKDEFIYNYKNLYLNDKFYNSIYNDFEEYIFDLVNLSRSYYEEYIDILEEKHYEKVTTFYNELYECYSIDDLLIFFSKKAPILRNLDEETKVKKEQFTNVLDDIKKFIGEYPSKDTFINDLKNSEYYVNILLDILIKLNKEVKKYKFDNLAFEFSDIAKMSIKCLKENPDELNKLKYSLNEILLDEYQDTNDLQEEFISLISNNNVYMVGDIKQSIYRFRNANPSIFMNKYESYKDNKGGMKIDLMKNFRSRQEVVDSINLIFSP
jgi:ATP-dependent helicase/nuclease subunit A